MIYWSVYDVCLRGRGCSIVRAFIYLHHGDVADSVNMYLILSQYYNDNTDYTVLLIYFYSLDVIGMSLAVNTDMIKYIKGFFQSTLYCIILSKISVELARLECG